MERTPTGIPRPSHLGHAAYSFGDGDLASARLGLVAAIFDPATCTFVDRIAPSGVGTVIDLGCGPGHTARLLSDRFQPDRVVGVDISLDFLRRAKELVPSLEPVLHDVTVPPFPGAPADMIFARLLLAHLEHIDRTVRRWLSQLRPGGLLLLDEIDWIHTDVDVLADYEAIVLELVRARGGPMYAGPALDRLAVDAAASEALVLDLRTVYPVDVGDAARMFRLNLAVWGEDPAVHHHRTSGRLDRLARGLEALAVAPHGTITWGLRQLAVRAPLR